MNKTICLGNRFTIANYKSAITEIVDYFKEVHSIIINEDDIELYTESELEYSRDYYSEQKFLVGAKINHYLSYTHY